MPPGDAKCPHGFTITGLCPKCDPKAYYQAVLDFLSKPTPLLGLPTADSYGVTGLSDAIDQQAKNPPLWSTSGAKGGGKKFTMDMLKQAHDEIMKAGPPPCLPDPFLPDDEPPAPRGAYHIGFMSEADVAEVRRAIGVRP